MWTTPVVLSVLFFCSHVIGEDWKVFDVTTILNITDLDIPTTGLTGRVHSGTNALGLPLYNGSALIEQPVKPNITCDSIQNICSWSTDDWVLSSSSLPKYGFDIIEKEIFHSLGKKSLFRLKSTGICHPFDFSIKLTPSVKSEDCDGYHEIKIYHKSKQTFSVAHRFCSCDSSNENEDKSMYENIIYDGSVCHGCYGWRRTFYCNNFVEFSLSVTSTLKIQFENGKLSFFENESILNEWTYTQTNLNYYLVTGDDKGILSLYSDCSGRGEVYKSNSELSEMVSPVVVLQERKLCLALVFHVSSPTEESVLDIFSEDISAERYFLDSVKQVLPGWNVKHINIILPGKSNGPVKLVIKKTNNTREIQIARISSCSYDVLGFESEVFSFSELGLLNLTQLAAVKTYSATAYAIEPAEKEAEQKGKDGSLLCMNGGVYTSAGCACPPGFNGIACQSGCGRNRFGQDCEGLCSWRRQECEGLLLCTYSTGCQCAPGYHGPSCQKKCSDGFYGNDCKQQCGRCAYSHDCDIYTGECSSCEFGYLPPNCTKESVYYPLAPLLSSPEYGVITVSFDPKKYKTNLRPPVLYQIQYKAKGWWTDWKTYTTKKYPIGDNTLVERLEGLQDGVLYKLRVLLIDDDFNKYDGDLVLISEIVTKCYIPEEYNYELAYTSDASNLRFSWNYVLPPNSHWCPVESYEVSWKEGWQRLTEETHYEEFLLKNILSGLSIQFRVRAKTSAGFSPYSEIINVSTQLTGILPVKNLTAESRRSSSVEVSWEPPRGIGNNKLRYSVSYECVDRPACSSGCETVSTGQQSVYDTHVTLNNLLPFTQYKVTVTPENGKSASVYVGTTDVAPTEVPLLSAQRPVKTNTSVTVFWEAVPVCSGFFLGYNYQLTKESDDLNILETGFTSNNSTTLYNLTASTQYIVKVFILTTAGWNRDFFLAINVSTSATVPEAVRNLTVYKKGRGMLGLRWAEPRATYGQLKSFTVTHSLGQDTVTHTVEPSRCVAWPDLYCHTIDGLKSNRRYNVSVSARNSEVPEDGALSFVCAVTKESPPSAPVNLKVSDSTSTSIKLQWNYPDMANGVLRSFLISVEETEKLDQDNCCQIYPFVETSVKEELQSYNSEVSGLHPASTYFVSVSGKTVGLGPSQTLVVSTRPPHLPVTFLPRIQEFEVTWLPQEKLSEVNNSDIYSSLVRAHIILAVFNESQPISNISESGVTDPKLGSLLQNEIGKPFFFIAEYNQDDDVDLSGLEDSDSAWGQRPASLSFSPGFQLVATQVLEYNGVYNVDLCYSQPLDSALD